MLLRDYLNEFELDWAQAPSRSGQISGKNLKGAKILLIGDQLELQRAIAWSFLAWNDKEKAGIRVQEAVCENGTLQAARGLERRVKHQIEEDAQDTGFAPKEADYVILTGFCCQKTEMTALETIAYLSQFEQLLRLIAETSCKKVLLLSDGRVCGELDREEAADSEQPLYFAFSEYEKGKTKAGAQGDPAQYLLQTMETMLAESAREHQFAYEILRTGMIYGAGISMMEHPVYELAETVASSEERELVLTPERTSYICIHDVLTAIQFVLTRCPDNKIFHASGLDSDAAPGEITMLLYQNFPQQCRIAMRPQPVQDSTQEEYGGRYTKQSEVQVQCDELHTEQGKSRTEHGGQHIQQSEIGRNGVLLNTQLLQHYGFAPQISLEDGLIILVKSLQKQNEVFIFDNTYLGKLDKVQKILLGYLLEIDRICKKHEIKYFLAGGTLLGAIRHHGFIPWDDDADVMMLREDYEKFQKVAVKELPANIFMQLPETEKGNYNPFTKLRINNTMFATEFTGHFMDMHNGIFFDVLSHDKTGNHKWSQKLHLMITMLSRSIVFNKWGNTDIKSGGGHPIICKIVDKAKYLIPMPFALWVQNKALTFFQNRKSDYLYDGMGRNLKRGAFPAKWLEETVYVDFEGYQFPVPKEYDKYLTWLYGDYMQMIPVSSRRTSHSIVLTDLGEYSGYELPEQDF